MNIERLVQMANDIANFFAAEPELEDAIAGVAAHIARFWEPRMREAIRTHAQTGGAGLVEIARQAVLR